MSLTGTGATTFTEGGFATLTAGRGAVGGGAAAAALMVEAGLAGTETDTGTDATLITGADTGIFVLGAEEITGAGLGGAFAGDFGGEG